MASREGDMKKITFLCYGIVTVGSVLGLVYSSISTSDFILHLDRQPHRITCSLLGGLEGSSDLHQEQPCKLAMYSPYSSFWRDKYWGGIPISLPALGVFGFALMISIWAFITRKGHLLAPVLALVVVALIAVITSMVYYIISITKVQAICKTCVGTYISSAILLIGSALTFLSARRERMQDQELPTPKANLVSFCVLLLELGLLVFIPVSVYVGALEDYTKYVRECETLKTLEDKQNILLEINKKGKNETIIVVDPMCPFCKEMDRRLKTTDFYDDLHIKVALLPLDAECNTMLADHGATTVSGHEGSCVISYAMLCAPSKAKEILEFAFENQEAFRDISANQRPKVIREKVIAKFPEVDRCLDASETKIKMNNTLRWASMNNLVLQTPQIFINGQRLCDADTDLGLEYALAKLTSR